VVVPPNRHGRVRIMEAMLRVAAERGYEATTVDAVVERAGVAAAEFDELFTGKEDCFLAAYDSALDLLVAQVSSAWESTAGAPWQERVTAALRALVDLFAAESDVARMAIVEVTALGEEARLRYRSAADRFIGFLDAGREVSPDAAGLPPETARFAIGGATSLIFDEIRAGRGPELERKLPDLVFAVTVPYLGAAGAEAEMLKVAAAAE
jgi:AcrR family transcriptional regulator